MHIYWQLAYVASEPVDCGFIILTCVGCQQNDQFTARRWKNGILVMTIVYFTPYVCNERTLEDHLQSQHVDLIKDSIQAGHNHSIFKT